MGFAFLPDQTEPIYIWALKKIKELYSLISPTVTLDPRTISTDYDQALRNAISEVFPESEALLCLWYANKNIQQHCKPRFTSTEAYNEFFEAWLGLVSSPDIPEY